MAATRRNSELLRAQRRTEGERDEVINRIYALLAVERTRKLTPDEASELQRLRAKYDQGR